MAQNKPTNLLDVAKTLDPRFVEDMPQEVADAFARGEVQRLIRTSDALPTAENAMGANVSKTGDYAGSIYVQLKNKTSTWILRQHKQFRISEFLSNW